LGRHSTEDAPRSVFFRADGEPIKKYLLIPQASPVDYAVKILIGGKGNLASIADRTDTTKKSKKQTVSGAFVGEEFFLFVKSAAEAFTIQVKDPDRIKSQKSPTAKVFLLLCYLINSKLRTRGGDLKDFTLEFPVSDLAKMGVFATGAAKATLERCLEAIQTIYFYGYRYQGEGKKVTQEKPSNLLEGFVVANGICKVKVNPIINFQFLAGYITPLPFWAFGLPNNKAFALMWSVFYFGRQRVQSVAVNRGFSIAMGTIRNRMMLPVKSKNPQRDVLNPVQESVESINAFAFEHEEQEEILLEVGYDYSVSEKRSMDKQGQYREYEPRTKGTTFDLDHAFVSVHLGGAYGEYISKLYKGGSSEDSLEGYE